MSASSRGQSTPVPLPKPYVCEECGQIWPYWSAARNTHANWESGSRSFRDCGPIVPIVPKLPPMCGPES